MGPYRANIAQQKRDERRLYWWGLALRVLAGLTAWFLTIYVELPLMQDALFYEEMAANVAQDWLAGRPSIWLEEARATNRPWLMITVLATCYFLAGGAKITPLLILVQSCITAFTPVLTYRIGRALGMPLGATRIAGWMVAVLPAFVFWAGAIYKEGLILLVLNLAVYQLLVLQREWNWRAFAIMLLCLPALFGLRFYLAVVVAAVVVFGLSLGRAKQDQVSAIGDATIRQLLLVGLLLFGLVGVGFTSRVQNALPADLQEGLEKMQLSRNDLAHHPSGYLPQASINTPTEAIKFFPKGLVYFLVVPLPWHIGSFRQNFAIPETALWIVLYPLVVVGIIRGLRQNFQGTVAIVAITVAMCCFYALFVGNIGTAYRMRVQVWVLWALFAGWGLYALRQRHHQGQRLPRRAGQGCAR